jgi:hypothetical protein
VPLQPSLPKITIPLSATGVLKSNMIIPPNRLSTGAAFIDSWTIRALPSGMQFAYVVPFSPPAPMPGPPHDWLGEPRSSSLPGFAVSNTRAAPPGV